MITFTKEQLIASAHSRIEFAEMMLSGELEPLKERTWSIELELARIAQAALQQEPVASFYRDGIVAAAAWVDKQREVYDNEHGRHDPGTGFFEFGSDLQRDYSATLEEISEGIRALHPNADRTAQTLTESEWAELQQYRKAAGEPIYQYRIRNGYNGQVTEWQTIRRDQVDFVLKAQPLSAEFQIVSAPQPAPEREQVRREHAAWSQATFGKVGPIGPLKHLSKEALEAAAEPGDLSEWADMQFLLWDAQRRAGISDGEITAAMEEKLKVNMARQWPEPKDGEPRLHIKAVSQPAPENNDRQTLRCLAVILAGNDVPGEIMALTVTAQSFVDRCKALVAERDELRKIVSAAKGDECTS